MFSFFATKGLIIASVVGVISLALRESGLYRPSFPIVETLNGPVRGVLSISRDGRDYFAFLGLPFAETPVRFQAPKPSKPWEGILDANRNPPLCYQYDAMVKGRFMGVEDCLKLNVYTPTIKGPLKPVIFWIHGGGFLSGGASMYEPTYLMDEDVVLVATNYRLGPLGFLNTGDEVIRGSMGLKDQQLSLQWVKHNIRNFGGDPDRITLMGESAGGASVHYHVLSPASKGLFQKAIIQSGSVMCPWSYTPNPRLQAINYGKRVNCPTENSSALVSCLMKLSPKELFYPMVNYMKNSPLTPQEWMFVPSVEGILEDDTFLGENPRVVLEEGRYNTVPLMFGINSGEGGLRTSRLEANTKALNSMDEKWNEFCPMLQHYDSKRTDISKEIRDFYFGKAVFSEDMNGFLKNFTQMISDGIFFQPIHKAASFHAKQGPVYMYYYNFTSTLPSVYSLMKAVGAESDWIFAEVKAAYSIAKDVLRKYFGYSGNHEYGVCHADDLFQLWKMQWPFQIGQSSSDYEFSKKFVKAIVDFAKDEKSLKFDGIDWPPIDPMSSEPFKYMLIDNIGKVIDEPFVDKLPFWNSLNIRNSYETHNW